MGWVRGPKPLVMAPLIGRMNRPLPEVGGVGLPRLTLAAICAWTALYSASKSALRARMPSMTCCSCCSAAATCSRSTSASERSWPTRSRSCAATCCASCAFNCSLRRSFWASSSWSFRLPWRWSSRSKRREFSPRYLLPAITSWAPPSVDSSVKFVAPPPPPLYNATADWLNFALEASISALIRSMSRWTVSTWAWMRAISASAASTRCCASAICRSSAATLASRSWNRAVIACSSWTAATSSADTSSIAFESSLRRVFGSGDGWPPAMPGATRPNRTAPATRQRRRRRGITAKVRLRNTSHTSNSRARNGHTTRADRRDPCPRLTLRTRRRVRSDVQEPTEADAGADRADDGATEQEADADRAGVPAGDVEALEEAPGGVELAQEVLESEDAAHRQHRTHCTLHQALGHERDSHEPVRGADELHDLDLAPAGEGGEPDRVHDQEQRRRDEDRRDCDEPVPEEVRDVDELLDRLVGGDRLIDTWSGVVLVAQRGRLLHLSRRDAERRRQRARVDRTDQVGLVFEDALEVVVGLLFRDVLGALDLPIVVQLGTQLVDLLLRGVGLHVDLEFDAVLPLVSAVIDPLLEQEDPAQEQQGHGHGEDPGQRHQEIAAQRNQRLAREVRQTAHHPISSRRRRRRGLGLAPCDRAPTRSRVGASRRRCAGRAWPSRSWCRCD